MGQILTKIGDNLNTIEKYCENNLRDSYNLSSLYGELRKSFYASCNQLKKPAAIYTNIVIPMCKKSATDFQNIYDVAY